jgi:hypothetical protein
VTNIRHEKEIPLGKSSSMVAIALKEEIGYVDDEVIRRIIGDCKGKVPDSTFEEIAHFSRLTARRVSRMRNVQNPIGLLIVQVPKCFEGESFRIYREAERMRKEAEQQELLQLANDVLRDPATSEDSRKWAADILAR